MTVHLQKSDNNLVDKLSAIALSGCRMMGQRGGRRPGPTYLQFPWWSWSCQEVGHRTLSGDSRSTLTLHPFPTACQCSQYGGRQQVYYTKITLFDKYLDFFLDNFRKQTQSNKKGLLTLTNLNDLLTAPSYPIAAEC